MRLMGRYLKLYPQGTYCSFMEWLEDTGDDRFRFWIDWWDFVREHSLPDTAMPEEEMWDVLAGPRPKRK